MLDVERWAELRREHFVRGVPIKELVRRTGLSRNTVRAALEVVHGSIQAGGKGVVFGRNIWQSPDPRAIVTALKAIIHGGQSVDAAMAEARLAG